MTKCRDRSGGVDFDRTEAAGFQEIIQLVVSRAPHKEHQHFLPEFPFGFLPGGPDGPEVQSGTGVKKVSDLFFVIHGVCFLVCFQHFHLPPRPAFLPSSLSSLVSSAIGLIFLSILYTYEQPDLMPLRALILDVPERCPS